MIRLSREIRFALTPPDQINARRNANSWAGWPSTHLIVPQLVLRCELAGEPDSLTGYLCNIKWLDDLLRRIVIENLIPSIYDQSNELNVADTKWGTAESMLRTVFRRVVSDWATREDTAGEVVSLALAVSPYLSYSIYTQEPAVVRLTQQFEFSAAHRLHCDVLSDEENRQLFGKCNNPAGHGHNYVVEVTVSRPLETTNETEQTIMPLDELETIVGRLVIDRLDHKHLNEDIEYFRTVNPSVENISIAIFKWLDGQLGAAKLETIRVYETPKTWAEYAGG